MYIPLSHFELTQMAIPEGAQQRFGRPLQVPKAECPQDESPADMTAQETGTFHVVRKSNDPLNIT